MKIFGWVSGFLIPVILLVWWAPAHAETAEKAVIILDASGSMWGKIEGKTKIEIARKTIKDILQKWDPAIHLGITAYGHREKGNCEDIEAVVPVGEVNPEAIISVVNNIDPKGKTPLSAAVRFAADNLKYIEDKATIILISDGKETCDIDPCALAKELEEKGVDFTAHVIGFDVTKDERAQLSCLAKNTGGKFYSAKNAQELHSAMSQTVSIIREGGLSAYWSFDNCDAEDSILGNNGTVFGNPECIDGVRGKALSLDGYDDYVKINNENIGNFEGHSTVALWLRVNKDNFDGNVHKILDKDYSAYWVLGFHKNKLHVWLRRAGGMGSPEGTIVVLDESAAQGIIDKWIFLAMVQNEGEYKIYINGKLAIRETTVVDRVNTGAHLHFGRSEFWKGEYYKGAIDEVRFYEKSLTEPEIQELYKTFGTPAQPVPSRPPRAANPRETVTTKEIAKREAAAETTGKTTCGIYKINADNTGKTSLVSEKAFWPIWSPDGKRIVYNRAGGIYLVNADGTGKVRLVDSGSSPKWSPDGKRIVYSLIKHQKAYHIYTINSDGTNKLRIVDNGFFPSLSPDGKRIVYTSVDQRQNRRVLYLINTDGTQQTYLAEGTSPVWSPDGKRIAYILAPGPGTRKLYVIKADGSDKTQVVRFGDSPSWSPDGRRIVFEDSYGVNVVNIDGSDKALLLPYEKGYRVSSWSWSPDGKRIAYTRANHKDTSEIYVINTNGSNKARLADFASNARWSPDGKAIVYQGVCN
jgi:Tol biopolymer transport system component